MVVETMHRSEILRAVVTWSKLAYSVIQQSPPESSSQMMDNMVGQQELRTCVINEEEEEAALDDIQASVEKRIRLGGAPSQFQTTANSNEEHTGNEVSIAKTESSGMDEETTEGDLCSEIATVIDLTGDEPATESPDQDNQQVRPPSPVRNAPVSESEKIPFILHGDDKLLLKPRVVVEIEEITNLYHASFLQIQYIIQSSSTTVLRGLPFTRTRNLRGQLQRLRNEVCQILQIDADDGRPDEEQAAVEVPVESVIRLRDVHCTNSNFPSHRYPSVYHGTDEVEEKAMLACRWKYRLVYKNAAARGKKQAPSQYIIAHLAAHEASTDHSRVSDRARLNAWRGSIARGGSYNINTNEDLQAIEDVDEDFDADPDWTDKKPGQRYTIGDMFCGAGGTSLGAQQVGFHIRVACDHAKYACMTHRHNFPLTDLRESDIYSFIHEDLVWGGGRDYVDVLHLSPPCQFWSPAHTVPGVNDEANIAVLFSCRELVKKLKPRIFTLEQTFGILHPRFEHYFNALVQGFTQFSYSVRWKVVDLRDWGLPSRRNRLVMIGACPGENLPPFPRSTHTGIPFPKSDLKPHVTVAQALAKISPNATMHEKKHNRYKKSWDPNVPLTRCITTHGGYGNYHWRGRRDFTLRELATMNGFPVTYQFSNRDTKKQIGNAFPPSVVRVLFGHIRKWLESRDRVNPVEEQAVNEDEPEYEATVTDIEDDELEFIRETARRRESGQDSDKSLEPMEVDGAVCCIDSNQQSKCMPRGSIVDLTLDSPDNAGPDSPVTVSDDD
ncbi:hypothetical protein JX265_009312 [Neoarthrinium moseri]|uniref:DNA (cytosine-5-)-methyltransferase n=1 Tax=Neoarthrinium moseri TaxID=1658444 RepID=A0A9P9WG67_9PEZI|nr:hypothetical protein JX265_009312 [Neoarthrinium moseri]